MLFRVDVKPPAVLIDDAVFDAALTAPADTAAHVAELNEEAVADAAEVAPPATDPHIPLVACIAENKDIYTTPLSIPYIKQWDD
jgi:hypothetical protein